MLLQAEKEQDANHRFQMNVDRLADTNLAQLSIELDTYRARIAHIKEVMSVGLKGYTKQSPNPECASYMQTIATLEGHKKQIADQLNDDLNALDVKAPDYADAFDRIQSEADRKLNFLGEKIRNEKLKYTGEPIGVP